MIYSIISATGLFVQLLVLIYLLNKKQVTGQLLYISIIYYIHKAQYHKRINSIKSKSYKLKRLISEKTPPTKFKVPIVNLPSYDLSELEQKQLHLGLEYSFVNKPKHLKKNITANFEIVPHRVSESINHDKLEDFHVFLRAYTDIFTKHIYATKDFTCKNLKNIIKDENVVILSGDKDSSIVIMQKDDYNHKLQQMIDEGIKNGIYTPTEDNTLNDLRKFQDFLRRNFKDKFARYEDMRPVSNQPGRIYATAKTHKFNSLDEINIDNLKFRPIISQIGTYTYNAAKVIAEYLKPLCSNQYKISDTQEFASLIKDQPPLNDDEEYVSYDVDYLFTNNPVAEIIE